MPVGAMPHASGGTASRSALQVTRAGPPHRLAQRLDMSHQEIRAPFQQIDRKEIGPARDPEASVVVHAPRLP
jgi:hypothetical protein